MHNFLTKGKNCDKRASHIFYFRIGDDKFNCSNLIDVTMVNLDLQILTLHEYGNQIAEALDDITKITRIGWIESIVPFIGY